MINLAGRADCDKEITRELEDAGIPAHKKRPDGNEVPAAVYGSLHGWEFTRAWYYWVAKSRGNGVQINRERALPLWDIARLQVRVGGHCDPPHPDEYGLATFGHVMSYHIDTLAGLRLFAGALGVWADHDEKKANRAQETEA